MKNVKEERPSEMSRIWSALSIILIMATTISRNLTDLCFVISGLIILYYEGRYKSWRGLKEVFSRLKLINYLIGSWLFANIIGYFFSTRVGPQQVDEIFSLRWIFCFYACVYLGVKMRFNEKAFRFTAAAYVVALVVGSWQSFIEREYFRFEGVFENPNVAAFSIAIPWVFLTAWESVRYLWTKKTDFFLVVLSLTMATMLFYTYGRGTWFAMGLVFCAISLVVRVWRNFIILLCVGVLAGALYRGNVLGVKSRVQYTFDLSAGNSQGVRIGLWKANWAIFLDYPVFGVGYFENLRMEVPYYGKLGISNYEGNSQEQYQSHAHNQYLQVLVGGGIVGFISYVLIFVGGMLFLHRCFKEAKSERVATFALGGFSMLFIFLGMGIFDSPLVSAISRNSFLIFLGLCIGKVFQEQNPIISRTVK